MNSHSTAVHPTFAKKAQRELPSMEVYEAAEKSGKILVIKHETEVPATLEDG